MALTPSEIRRRKMNMLMAMSYATFASSKAWTPLQLFSAGEQGAWYDPSDFNTMFQDSAGTTPVTAVEQPVGLILDKSGRGNHASQSTTTSRPVLSARVNLLTYSEQFDNAAWTKVTITSTVPSVTANAAVAPDGTTTADKVDYGVIDDAGDVSAIGQGITTIAATHSGSVWIKGVAAGDFGKTVFVYFSDAGTLKGKVAVTVSDEWQYITINASLTAGANRQFLISALGSTYGGANQAAVSVYLWGADLRVTNVGTNLPAYQRIAAATDYDTTGFPYYLRFDGTDDSLATGTINPGSIDSVQIFTGVRKLSDAAQGMLLETNSTGNGRFSISAPAGAVDNYQFATVGTAAVFATISSQIAPITNVITAFSDISTPVATIRNNGVVAQTSASSQGTGNYLTNPLNIGRRAGSSLPYNGHLYGLIVRFGASLSAAQIASTEAYVNSKTGAY